MFSNEQSHRGEMYIFVPMRTHASTWGCQAGAQAGVGSGAGAVVAVLGEILGYKVLDGRGLLVEHTVYGRWGTR